jgi:hypothetical protein
MSDDRQLVRLEEVEQCLNEAEHGPLNPLPIHQ